MSNYKFSHKKFCNKCFKIAKIKGGSSGNKSVYLGDNPSNDESRVDNITFTGSTFKLVPHGERLTMFIVGESGLGKSYYAAQIAKSYKKRYPKNPVVLISPKKYDKPLDELNVHRISITEENFLDPDTRISLPDGELDNTLIIFDDIEGIADKKLMQAVDKLKDDCLILGRSSKTSVIYISHLATAGHQTKRALYETAYFVFSPRSRLRYQIMNVLKNYMGLTKDQIKKIFNTPCRMLLVSKDFPSYVMGSDCIYFL